ncbi:voltage-gated chloride channel family protein [Chitinophaga sp. Mgbs1]|uniref:Voltage-gated chloride channel family protein n=1 Tax=Chitinophaga solisilvae TaxID=1233460 RepID=A0A9Q5D9Z8_9BACT|nr:voltage-gated chloride channel family protein [Chitinophaga solisilvae]
MKQFRKSLEQLTVAYQLLRWTLLVLPVAVLAGSMVALFLWLLDKATHLRWEHEWLLYLLPLSGIVIYWLYRLGGRNAEKGNNLIMEEIHQPGGGVPARMAPLVLLTTIITHLFGGSAGREGTAVQIGGSIAGLLSRKLGLTASDTRILLMTGIAAGFGAVFGTPVTGAVFALEVLAIGVMRYNALIPCLIAAVLADVVCSAWGITHTKYHIDFSGAPLSAAIPFIHTDLLLLLKVILAGVAFGLTSLLFSRLMHTIKHNANAYIKIPWLIPVAGGLMIIALCYVAGTWDYLGLGVMSKDPDGISIVNAFREGGRINDWSWLWKLVFTAVTLGMGFKGGEVTPLFFMGAALGHTLALLMGAPVDLFAALGFIAVFAGATNTPIACTLMGIELFGGTHVLYFGVACFTAYYFSGHSGIYGSQRLVVPKYD